MEHEVCKGCRWSSYPTCKGTIMIDGSEMNIENLKLGFICGRKDLAEIMDFSSLKTEKEIKIELLEARILELESKAL